MTYIGSRYRSFACVGRAIFECNVDLFAVAGHSYCATEVAKLESCCSTRLALVAKRTVKVVRCLVRVRGACEKEKSRVIECREGDWVHKIQGTDTTCQLRAAHIVQHGAYRTT